MVLNAARMGLAKPRPSEEKFDPLEHSHFETLALPVALRKKMGVIVMQVFAQEKRLPTMPAREMLKLSRKLAATGKASLDRWFAGSRDV